MFSCQKTFRFYIRSIDSFITNLCYKKLYLSTFYNILKCTKRNIIISGMVGMKASIFSQSGTSGPKLVWEDPKAYPAIKGITNIRNVTFKDFSKACQSGKYNYVWMTSPKYGDILHPKMQVSVIFDLKSSLYTGTDYVLP